MAMVLIHASNLSPEAKTRIGEQVITALHNEDVPASSVVVLFMPERADLYLDGGPLMLAPGSGSIPAAAPARPASLPSAEPAVAPLLRLEAGSDFKTRARRTKGELSDLKERLIKALRASGGLSSFDAQKALDLQECDWAPATLRRFFAELEDEGLIRKEGQKRGTRYVLAGPKPSTAVPILQKKEETEA